MSRIAGVLAVVLVVLLAMGFAAANAGHVVTLDLGLVTFYRVPVTLVAFAGLFTGMVVMFATGIHADLKVRRILRDRLSEESRREQKWIDRDQRDLFSGESGEPSAREPVLPRRGRELEPGPAAGPKPGPESGPEPGPEPGPKPGPESGPEPGPTPGPESGPVPDVGEASGERS